MTGTPSGLKFLDDWSSSNGSRYAPPPKASSAKQRAEVRHSLWPLAFAGQREQHSIILESREADRTLPAIR